MKFDYLKEPYSLDTRKPYIARPMIPIRLSLKAMKIETFALIDSGADQSLFNASFAHELLIDLEDGKKQTFRGIGEGTVDVYLHTIKLQIIGSPEALEIEVGFTESSGVDAILGQADFFKHHKITFERYKERMEIKPANKH